MTVRELIEELEKFPGDVPVVAYSCPMADWAEEDSRDVVDYVDWENRVTKEEVLIAP